MNLVEKPSLEGIELCYNRGMCKWIERLKEEPTTKEFEHHFGLYKLDVWRICIHPEHEAAIISIQWKDELIWQMNYSGHCSLILLRWLRLVHWRAWDRGIFLGGRGREQEQDRFVGYEYTNTVYFKHHRLQRFMGIDEIRALRPTLLGTYPEGRFLYRGGLVNSSHYNINDSQKLVLDSEIWHITPSRAMNDNRR